MMQTTPDDGRTFLAIMVSLAVLVFFLAAATAFEPNYLRSINNVLVSEGGAHYTNHPSDPGGPTKWGVTIHDMRRYVNSNATAQDVKDLSKEVALEIYRQHYAAPIQFDRLPRGVDYSLLDYSIAAGTSRAVRDFARVLKVPLADTVTDDMVAAATVLDPLVVIQALNDRRMVFQMGLGPRFNVFKRGWHLRINSVNAIALGMAGKVHKSFMREFLIPMIGNGKAYEEETNGTI